MNTVITYIQMGGYGWFVWPAYAVTATIMVWLVVSSLVGLRADAKILDALVKANPRRGNPPHPGADTPEAPAPAKAEQAEAGAGAGNDA